MQIRENVASKQMWKWNFQLGSVKQNKHQTSRRWTDVRELKYRKGLMQHMDTRQLRQPKNIFWHLCQNFLMLAGRAIFLSGNSISVWKWFKLWAQCCRVSHSATDPSAIYCWVSLAKNTARLSVSLSRDSQPGVLRSRSLEMSKNLRQSFSTKSTKAVNWTLSFHTLKRVSSCLWVVTYFGT